MVLTRKGLAGLKSRETERGLTANLPFLWGFEGSTRTGGCGC